MKSSIIYAAILSLFIVLSATAGTYLNESSTALTLRDLNDRQVVLEPGHSLQTYRVYDIAGLTKTSDAPYYNPLVARHIVSSTGPGDDQDITLNPATAKYLYIWKVTGSGIVTVFYTATANTPPAAILRSGDRYQQDVRGRVGNIVLQFSAAGTCEIVETADPIE